MEPREGGPDREERVYPWWWVLPLQPYALRETVREELVPGWMWGFEQAHGAIDIVVNIRMTVVRMSGGGLWVHAPVAPTQQCLRLLRELEREFGPVKHIVHPTYAVEHKVFVGPFARACREADVWVAPGQWSFPLQLPMSMLGVFPKRVNVIGRDRALWTGEFVPKALSLPLRGAGPFVEVAFVHRATRTLLVTDTLVCPQPAPPRVCTSDPLPLLLIARDSPEQPVEDGEDKRLEGWMKTALLALYLRPDAVFVGVDGAFSWRDDWREAFAAVSNRVLVPPVLRKLILNRDPRRVLEWADDVAATGGFTHIVAAHFSGRAPLTPDAFLEAFGFLGSRSKADPIDEQCTLLDQVNNFLVRCKLAEAQPDN